MINTAQWGRFKYDPSTNTIKKSSTRSWDDRRCFLLRFRWISIFFVLLVPLDCFDAFQFLIHSYQTRWSHNSTHNVNKAASYIYIYIGSWFGFPFRSVPLLFVLFEFYFILFFLIFLLVIVEGHLVGKSQVVSPIFTNAALSHEW